MGTFTAILCGGAGKGGSSMTRRLTCSARKRPTLRFKDVLFVPLALAACASSPGKVAPGVDAATDTTEGVDRHASNDDAREVAATSDRPVAVDMTVADLM